MGACVSPNSKQGQPLCEKLPDDINSFDPQEASQFNFEGFLSHAKIENVAPETAMKLGVLFNIPEVAEIYCPPQEIHSQKIKWDINANFFLQANDYEIRSKFLTINITDDKKQLLVSLKINLYKIMVGPFHHDFKISKGRKVYGRLIFDLNINQIVETSIESLKTKIQFTKEYPGERFHYLIEAHNTHQEQKEIKKSPKRNSMSYVEEIPLSKQDQFRPITEADQAPSPTTRIRRKGSALIKQQSTSELVWKNSQTKKLPTLSMKLKANQICSESLTIKLFRLANDQKRSDFGECSLRVSQLLKEQKNSIKKQEQKNLQKDSSGKKSVILKKLYYNGKVIADCELTIGINIGKFIKQMNSRTHTEDGIVNMHHFETYESESCMKIQEKTPQKSQMYAIYKKMVELLKKQNTSSSNQTNWNMYKLLEELDAFASKSLKSSLIYYSNQNICKLQEKQNLNINILKLMCTIIQDAEDDIQLEELCWKICIDITKRGEMMLRNWGFIEVQQKMKVLSPSDKNFGERTKIAQEYCKVMFMLLKRSLETERLAYGEKQHAQMFKAFCYFRIPLFRQKMLEVLADAYHELPEGIVIDIFDSEDSYLCSDVNWGKFFYEPLSSRKKMKEEQASLENYLEDHKWFDRLISREEIVFDFVRYFMVKIVTIREHHKIDEWGGLPGYEIILSAALSNISRKKIGEWTYPAILMCISLLQNEAMFPSLLRILYSKTNLNNQVEVRQMLAILSQFLNQQTSNNDYKTKYLSAANFPYKYFATGLKLILQNSLNHLSLRLTLIFIFKFYMDFDIPFRCQFSQYLLGSVFWKLFYFWSYDVRDVYYHIIILKIAQDKQIMRYEDVSNRLKACLKIIRNSYELSHQVNLDKECTELAKKPLHNQMKNKLKNKLRANTKLSLSLKKSPFKRLEMNFDTLINHAGAKEQEFNIQQYVAVTKPKGSGSSHKSNGSPQFTRTRAVTVSTTHSNLYSLSQREQSHIDLDMTHHISDNKMKDYGLMNSNSPKLKKQASLDQPSSHTDFLAMSYGFNDHQLQIPYLDKHELKEISRYFYTAAGRFKEVLALVNIYFIQNGCLPCMEDKLSVLGVKIDKKDIMPEELHFEVFD